MLIHALPIFHVHGLFVAVHCALLNASTMLWMGKFKPQQALEWFAQATVFMGVPTLYVRLLQEAALTPERCAHMRLFISGSAPLLVDTFREWQERCEGSRAAEMARWPVRSMFFVCVTRAALTQR